MSIFDTLDPFDENTPFSMDTRSHHNEQLETARRWRELHESVEAKLLEVAEVGEPPPSGHPHPGVWAAYITGAGLEPNGERGYTARALTEPSIVVGELFGVGPYRRPLDREFDERIVEYAEKIPIPNGFNPLNPPGAAYQFARDSYCQIVRSLVVGNGGATGACRFGSPDQFGLLPSAYQCLPPGDGETECTDLGGVWVQDFVCFDSQLDINAYERPLDPVFCPEDPQPGGQQSMQSILTRAGVQQLGQQLLRQRRG